ncbi:MAG: shikimate kinase / 3-dehydroquinate synthase [Gaiellales bacterium]|jgi:shikimate kinase/3-dehydroquinate synthase|nr:shikimate kinase / 3-dehydroquinate synthase [Gaiellales bacterium]
MIPGPYRNIALIGFMGAGKSTLALQLAERLGWHAADCDAEVEREAGKPIAQIFADDGESVFRELEQRVAARLLDGVDTVVAMGGGAVTSPVTRERLRDGSFTVLLDVSAQTAWRRIEAQAGDRPLAIEARGFAQLYEQRRGLYHATADALVDAERLEGSEPLLVPLSRPAALAELPRLVGARRCALIADRNVLRLVGAPVEPLVTVRLPAGEAAKTVAVARQAWTRLADLGLERSDVVVALGGGAATDAAGFVAATYQRGVPWIAAPTSLVGMVDAAIGGKTGLDLPGAKNYVGAFHPAEWVVTDPGLLETLPVREWACGFAEVIKTGLLAGGRLWEMVCEWQPGRGSTEQRLELIRRCAAYKAHVVATDPREQGMRAVLNLGHSIGHAMEAAAGFRGLAHGEAVAVGLLPALWLSTRLAGLDPSVEAQVRELLALHELPLTHPGLDPAAVREALRRDKKSRGGRVRFVLLEAIGAPVWGIDVDDELIDQAIARAIG